MDANKVDRALEAWKVTIGVQQHFNDIGLKVRQFALTVLAAVLAASAAVLDTGTAVKIWGFTTSLAVLFLLAGALVWLAFYFVDRIWYHPLLLGAVKHAEQLEEMLTDDVPGISLTRSISNASPVTVVGHEMHSGTKMSVFYVVIFVVLLALATGAHRGAQEPSRPSTATPAGEAETSGLPCWRPCARSPLGVKAA